MMKKMTAFLATALLSIMLVGGAVFVSAEGESSTALFVQSVVLAQADDTYTVTYRFDKAPAEAEADITEQSASKLSVNGTKLSDIESATLAYVQKDGVFQLEASIPAAAGIVKVDGSDRAVLEAGLEAPAGYRTTVRYIFDFDNGLAAGSRIYRSDNMDDYESVTVTGLSVPEYQSTNMSFYVYLSESVVSKKLIDLQVRTVEQLKIYHGDKGDKQFSDAELDLLHDYEIIGADWNNSLLYKTMFGCESYNGLEAFPGNHSGSAPDMTPQTQVDGIDLYNLYQIQEQTADTSLIIVDKNGEESHNGGSLQPLVVQIHMENNHIQFVFKGDSQRDRDVQKILMHDNTDTGLTSLNENIAPDMRETMVVGLKAGFLFPNGKMLKEDVMFSYDPVRKAWLPVGDAGMVSNPDETLDNQEGYTDEELALREQSDANGGGCGAIAFGGGNGGNGGLLIPVVMLFCAAALALGRTSVREK